MAAPQTTATERYAAVPDEMKQFKQWVVFKKERPNAAGKVHNVPYCVDGRRHASSTDSSTWSSFAEATSAVEQGRGDGISFVLTENDPYVGIDIDGVSTKSGPQIPEGADELIHVLGSYAEWSPSGHGFRIFVKSDGKLDPCLGYKCGVFEIYDKAKILTVTGDWCHTAYAEETSRNKKPLPLRFLTAEQLRALQQYLMEIGRRTTSPALKRGSMQIPTPKDTSESGIDWAIIGSIRRERPDWDIDQVEAEFERLEPERYARQNAKHSGHPKGYIRYSIRRHFERVRVRRKTPSNSTAKEAIRRALLGIEYGNIPLPRREWAVMLLKNAWWRPYKAAARIAADFEAAGCPKVEAAQMARRAVSLAQRIIKRHAAN